MTDEIQIPDFSASPLNEPTIGSLDELFSRDPLELSAQDIDSIVSALREQRKKFVLSEQGLGKKPKAIDLKDLDIQL